MPRDREYKVGQPLIVKIAGIPTEATIKAISETTEGRKFIVDFGHEQVATVDERDIVQEG
jgi:hypothetical protein